ncbi:MAG: diiron oxygenase [Candidatus Binatia bacterium]
MPNRTTTAGDVLVFPPPEEAPRERETYAGLVARLSRQSVAKHFDAYADVPWDDPEFGVDPGDPRWELPADEGLGVFALGGTAWYQSQDAPTRRRLSIHLFATLMKVGVQFENVLQRGLLDFAMRLPNGAPEFRYVYHEVIEEGQHSLMFQEFVNRTGLAVDGMPWVHRVLANTLVVRLARSFPELFFMFVLGGEDPIDHVQRVQLQKSWGPPIVRRISQIHMTEEARHLCFARHFLRQRVPRLSKRERFMLAMRTPFLLSQMSRRMLEPSVQVIREYAIPRPVLDAAFRRNPAHRAGTQAAVRKVRELCVELGLVTPLAVRRWKQLGLWDGPLPTAT